MNKYLNHENTKEVSKAVSGSITKFKVTKIVFNIVYSLILSLLCYCCVVRPALQFPIHSVVVNALL